MPASLNLTLPPSASKFISPATSKVKSPASDMVEPLMVISSTVRAVRVPTLVMFA